MKKTLKQKVVFLWNRLLVFLGFRVWARRIYCRPKFHPCAFHGTRMKRQGKTEFGAFYYCPQCRRSYHLESKGNKLVPV